MSKSDQLIKRHEGLSLKPYQDTVGVLTIGYGYNLDEGISQEVADLLFIESMSRVHNEAVRFDWYAELTEARKAVIENMLFNLGLSRFLGFKKMISALETGHYKEAAIQMMDSKWSGQVGRRAVELSRMMDSGVWNDD